MPKEITHIVIADDILRKLPAPLAREISLDKKAYYFGSMSPDLFYYDFHIPGESESAASISEAIHGRNGEDNMSHVFRMLRSPRLEEKNSGLFSFLAGHLTHMAADSFYHPLIYSVSGNYYDPDHKERNLAERRHRIFESCMDLYFLKQTGETLTSFHLIEKLLPGKNKEAILSFYASSLSDYTSANDTLHRARRSLKKCVFLIRSFINTKLHKLLYPLSGASGGTLDFFLNLCYLEHRAANRIDFARPKKVPHPITGQPYEANIEKLRSLAVLRGLDFILQADRLRKKKTTEAGARKILRPYSLNIGLERIPTDRMKFHAKMSGIDSWRTASS